MAQAIDELVSPSFDDIPFLSKFQITPSSNNKDISREQANQLIITAFERYRINAGISDDSVYFPATSAKEAVSNIFEEISACLEGTPYFMYPQLEHKDGVYCYTLGQRGMNL